LNKAQKDFLASISIKAKTPDDASSDKHPVKFEVRSGKPNPALAASRRVTVEPPESVNDGAFDESAWPDKSSAVDHTAKVNPEVTPPGLGPLKFTAKLNMPPVAAVDFPEKKFDVEIYDKRLDWFKTNIKPGITIFNERDMVAPAPGLKTPYYGGQLPLTIV